MGNRLCRGHIFIGCCYGVVWRTKRSVQNAPPWGWCALRIGCGGAVHGDEPLCCFITGGDILAASYGAGDVIAFGCRCHVALVCGATRACAVAVKPGL